MPTRKEELVAFMPLSEMQRNQRSELRKEGCPCWNCMKDLMTVDEACEALRIGKNALYRLLASQELKAYRNSRVWRIPRQAVELYIRTQSKL